MGVTSEAIPLSQRFDVLTKIPTSIVDVALCIAIRRRNCTQETPGQLHLAHRQVGLSHHGFGSDGLSDQRGTGGGQCLPCGGGVVIGHDGCISSNSNLGNGPFGQSLRGLGQNERLAGTRQGIFGRLNVGGVTGNGSTGFSQLPVIS
jgi:hypothetical protein